MQANAVVENKWVCNGVTFAPGDRVKITGFEEDFAPDGMGDGVTWDNQWPDIWKDGNLVGGMSMFIGYEYEINDIDETGVYFVTDESHTNMYGYPLTVLEKIK
jgi:hypothetical protein